jgi:hypothetical protein
MNHGNGRSVRDCGCHEGIELELDRKLSNFRLLVRLICGLPLVKTLQPRRKSRELGENYHDLGLLIDRIL